jgi:hypothetical protein
MMDKNIAIKIENVSKTFRIPHEKISSLRGAFVSALKMKENSLFRGIIKIIALDKCFVFAIIDSAKTTRSAPLGHGGF